MSVITFEGFKFFFDVGPVKGYKTIFVKYDVIPRKFISKDGAMLESPHHFVRYCLMILM